MYYKILFLIVQIENVKVVEKKQAGIGYETY